MDILPPVDLRYAYDGRAELVPSTGNALPPYVQAPPFPPPAPAALLEQLRREYLTWDLCESLKDVSKAGHFLKTTFPRGSQWPDVSLPTSLVEPMLPAGPEGHVAWRVVEAGATPGGGPAADPLALQRRQAARGGGSDANWRGFSVSMPYLPGGGVSVGSGPSPAARQAASGVWLQQLESGRLPRVSAPGLSSGVFGPWQSEEVVEEVQEPEAQIASGTSGVPAFDRNGSSLLMEPLASALAAAADSSGRPEVNGGVFSHLWKAEEEPEEERPVADVPQEKGPAPTALESVAGGQSRVGSGDVDRLLAAAPAVVPTLMAQKSFSRVSVVKRGKGAEHAWAVQGGIADVETAYAQVRPQMALHFPFELDTFQKEAVCHLEAGRSVFVAAHTSAGKTVVAEYAFALATRHCTRAIYTSPIKTISNQKFRDFSAKFDVGLLTGDVQIRPSAPCLIMTTEILRSMLYKGADVLRDVEWVVFDEVHYVNDVERGVVWEEVIIMLPPHIGLVMLSATVPNVMDFAGWVGRTKRKVIYVAGTLKRPVPLEHSLYYGGELYTVCSKDQFMIEGVRKAQAAHKLKNAMPETRTQEKAQRPTGRGDGAGPSGGSGRGGFGARGGSADNARRSLQGASRAGGPNSGPAGLKSEKAQLLELIGLLGKKSMLPVAIFCFSKKRCDAGADAVSSLDLTTNQEKHAVHAFVERCLARLKEGDRQLPQILRLRDLMRRGLAVHHAGLLPIMKEVVEMLFCQGYIKVLFCTETFAMGVNAPTRTVVFHSLRKHDGKNFRYLLPGEYTQMAGRAGRRGLDPVGHVLLACWDEPVGESELRAILQGKGVQLASQFRLTYSMILNLLRVEDLKVEDMLKRSFAEFHAQRGAPAALAELATVKQQLASLEANPWPASYLGCSREEVEEYYGLSAEVEALSAQLQDTLNASKAYHAALVPGRIVLYHHAVSGLTETAVVLGDAPSSSGSSDRRLHLLALHKAGSVDERHQRQLAEERVSRPFAGALRQQAEDEFMGMKMVGKGGGKGAAPSGPGPLPHYGSEGGLHYLVVEAAARDLRGVGKNKLKVDSEAILSGQWEGDECRRAITVALRSLQKSQDEADASPGGLPLMDPRADFRIVDLASNEVLTALARAQAALGALRPHRDPGISEAYGRVRAADLLSKRKAGLEHTLSDALLSQLPEFEQRVAVLQSLGYLEADRSVTLKGRVACEINSCQDELVASEMVFAGLLGELTPEEAVALLSALVFQEKSEVEPRLPPSLAAARDQLVALTQATAQVQKGHGLDVVPDEYCRTVLHTGLMEVVYEWARGTPFRDICDLSDVMEGSVVRAMVRLEQACRELQDAARVMGNTQLFQQMQAASAAIKRDVIFAASLYVA